LKFKIVKLSRFSGNKSSLYSVIIEGEQETLFDTFIRNNVSENSLEVEQIFATLNSIGKRVGASDNFFRKKKEGKAGDGVEAIYDSPSAKLRLYCIRYGSVTLVLGDGGEKKVRAWQDDAQLSKAANEMIKISQILTQAIRDGDLSWDGNDFVGQFEFNDNDEDED
jgi:hypothetical protein